jgi:gliding motility-associated-like protein
MSFRQFGLLLLLFISTLFGFSHNDKPQRPNYEIIENRGQWNPIIKFSTRIPGGIIYLEDDAISYDLWNREQYSHLLEKMHDNPGKPLENNEISGHFFRIHFKNLDKAVVKETYYPAKHYYNYYLGNNPERWASKVHPVKMVRYHNIYPGTHFEFIASENLKYQWVIEKPNSDKIQKIRYDIQGADSVYVKDGQLVIANTVNDLIENKPYAYQIIDEKLVEIPCEFMVEGNEVFFKLPTELVNPNYNLVIDPILIFSTYNGNYADNFGFTATYDEFGNLYAGGTIAAPGYGQPYGFPATPGAYSTTFSGGTGRPPVNLASDIAISKYDSSGSNLLWATYLGGADTEHPHSLIADNNNDLIILGTTFSNDYPVSNNALQKSKLNSLNQTTLIISKLTEDGSSLPASTYISGNNQDGLITNTPLYTFYADDFRGDVIVNNDNEIYIATCTNSPNLPIKNAFQATKGSGLDGYFAKLNPDLSELLWGSYLGGNGADALFSIKLNDDSMVYVAGGTSSSNLPATAGAFKTNNSGDVDGFVAALSERTNSIEHLTYWGGSNYDQIYFIDLDNQQRVFATGLTTSSIANKNADFGHSNRGQFITRLTADLSQEELVTTFGTTNGQPELAPSAFMVDICNKIYFSGWGANASSANLPVTPDAMQSTSNGRNFYLMTLSENARDMLFATFFGGNDPRTSGDHVDGGTSRFDKNGIVYQSVCASCPSGGTFPAQISDFPTTPNARFTNNVSERCSNASFKIDMLIAPNTIAQFIPSPNSGCMPLEVSFTNLSQNFQEIKWYFGNGDSSDLINPTYTYNEPGQYEVMLVAISEENCEAYDTAYAIIEVFEISEALFEAEVKKCSREVTITDKSVNGKNLDWDMGDGNLKEGELSFYEYKENGTYEIKLIVNKNSNCPDSIKLEIEVDANEVEDFMMYNIFTPDGDGLNDCFKPLWIDENCLEIEWFIYNRWGEKLFDSTKDPGCWDGIDPATNTHYPAGTYYYIVRDKTAALWSGKSISGVVTLILDQ